MIKIIVLQRYYGLGDEQIEYQIKDRTSFRDFLGIECVGDVPDEKAVWKFKDILAKNGTEHMFGFMEQNMKGLIFRGVGIVRATFNIGLTNLVYNIFRYTQLVNRKTAF